MMKIKIKSQWSKIKDSQDQKYQPDREDKI